MRAAGREAPRDPRRAARWAAIRRQTVAEARARPPRRRRSRPRRPVRSAAAGSSLAARQASLAGRLGIPHPPSRAGAGRARTSLEDGAQWASLAAVFLRRLLPDEVEAAFLLLLLLVILGMKLLKRKSDTLK